MKKNNSIKIAVATAAALLMTADASAMVLKKKIGNTVTKVKIYGFSQIQAEGGDGSQTKEGDVSFKAQRIRLGVNYAAGPLKGKLFLDFNNKHTDAGGVGLEDMIKDAFIAYKFSDAAVAKFGLIKQPHGMSFTIPGWNLDIVERSFDKKLALERNMGLMLSGRDIGFGNNGKVTGTEMGHERPWKGFGYDVQIANQAGRSASVVGAKAGNGNSYAARAMFDWTEVFHTELSYGLSESAAGLGVSGDEDYKSINFGIDSHFGRGNFKYEYYDSESIKGVKGWDETTHAVTGTYFVTDTVEVVAKHVMADAEKGGVETDLTNTYLGFNYYIAAFDNKMNRGSKRKRNAHRIQANYVIAGGDTEGKFNGNGGVKDDKWVVTYQYKF